MGTFSVTQETSLRSLHYMIANRFFPCNETLHIWYPNHSKLRTHCNIADTIVHYFVECLHVENLFLEKCYTMDGQCNWCTHSAW